MEDASLNMDFEKAIEYRDLINSINDTILRQKISINDLTSRDYIGVYKDNEDISINIIITRLGNIIGNHQTILSLDDASEDPISNYIIQYYDINDNPKEICAIGLDLKPFETLLESDIVEPKTGKKKELLDMALYNAKFNLENKRNIYKNTVLKKVETIEELGKLLGINTPYRIEAFDNSNLFGEYPVSAMVTYINGKASPKDFRKYHIKTVLGANDYESMKEVVYRRYYRLLMEDSKMPDLIVMDGGEIQVHACLDVIKSLNLDIPVLGIQKDDHHKATILFFNEKLINIDKNSAIYLLLADISQRVHDFAISFFRSEKAKGFFASYLDGISGLGKKRKETLIKHFITVDNIKNAKIDEIRSLGIPEDVAVKIHTKLNENN
jgi:excinuclease ABC subunit C